jgi:DNA-binding transcriptional ArsR family regulator
MMSPAELPPPAALLELMIGRWVSDAIGVAARLGLADEVASGPRPAEEIAAAIDVDPPTLRRLLRALASAGVFAEHPDGRYGNTALSEQLRTGPTSLRSFALMVSDPAVTRAWDDLLASVRAGTSAFERVNGASLFTYFESHPALGDAFNAAMTARSAMELDGILACLDVASVRTLVDVGGGHGLFLARLLAQNPEQRGVLFDLPRVIAGAGRVIENAGIGSRVELVPGNFFEAVPRGADGYVLKRILHDWNDDDATRILRRIHAAAAPGARLFILDAVLAPGNAPDFAKLLDLQMLVFTSGGRERTRPEWDALLSAAGFALHRVIPTPAPIAILEAQKVELIATALDRR